MLEYALSDPIHCNASQRSHMGGSRAVRRSIKTLPRTLNTAELHRDAANLAN